MRAVDECGDGNRSQDCEGQRHLPSAEAGSLQLTRYPVSACGLMTEARQSRNPAAGREPRFSRWTFYPGDVSRQEPRKCSVGNVLCEPFAPASRSALAHRQYRTRKEGGASSPPKRVGTTAPRNL